MKKLAYSLSLILVLSVTTVALPFKSYVEGERVRKALNRAKVSAVLFQRLLDTDFGLKNVMKEARAVAIFPAVSKARNFWGSKISGAGVISRRIGTRSWTAPAFFEISKKTSTGIKGSASTIVLVFREDAAVDALRKNKINLGYNHDISATTPDEPPPSTGPGNVSYFEYVEGIPVTPNMQDAQIKSNGLDNKAVYKLDSKDVLFFEREKALEVHHESLSAFATTMNDLAPNTDNTPKINEFFDAGYDYTIFKALDTIKEHIKNYFTSQRLAYREEQIEQGVIITGFKDLPDKGRRHRRTAFLIKIMRTTNTDRHTVWFRWHVSSRGEDEKYYRILDEDKNAHNEDAKLKQFVDEIDAEIRKLK